MKRRDFITLLGGMAVAWPLAARAQQNKGPVRLGFLPLGSPSNPYDRSLVEAFQQGLRRVGLIENRDIVLDVVWTIDDADQAVSEVLRRGAHVLIPCGSSASVAAKRQTSTIPIVFLSVGDPIAMGLVESLPHPGRNATGFSDILGDLSGKLVDLARELIKPETTVDYLWQTTWPEPLPSHREGDLSGRNEASIKRDRRHCRIGQRTYGDETERLDGAHRSAEPALLRTTRTNHRIGDEEWPGDDICFPDRSEGGFIDRVRPRLPPDVQSSSALCGSYP